MSSDTLVSFEKKKEKIEVTHERRYVSGRPVLVRLEDGVYAAEYPMREILTTPERDRYFKEAQTFIKALGAVEW